MDYSNAMSGSSLHVDGQLQQIAGALDTDDVWLKKHDEQAKIDNAVREMREACEKIGEVANTVNEAIRENERLEELYEIQESMKNLGGRTMMDNDRWLVKRGAHKNCSNDCYDRHKPVLAVLLFACILR